MICLQNGNVGKLRDQYFIFRFFENVSFSYWDIKYRKRNNTDC